ncbi:unnamed protein product [Aspergillus oryzae]|uniref:Unnamed protein product n=1 Tax=Aspergillus oryzae var. brunneus TaxID=332754 RepID=A0ABQ6K9G4_ASPOZ|nr:unnamed protein product [Aspergillus oryzae]GMF86403.1 unnamed protein product [Aspergillus oryzae]GMG40935.1 unnamed protein product [Aspergillus oryzae var. brunneus]
MFKDGAASPSDTLPNGMTMLHFPEETVPLVTRSTAQLHSLIRQRADMKDWILLYANWPEGVLLLLQAGYKAHEYELYAALDFDCESSVCILIETGNVIVGYGELWAATRHPNSKIADLIIQALVDRRKRLQLLAEAHLSVDELSELKIRPDVLIDLQTQQVIQILRAKNIDLSGAIEPYPWSVYEALGHNYTIADRVWEAGFRDVDVPCVRGRTLLMTKRCETGLYFKYILEEAAWLLGKGAQPYRLCENTPALHFVGFAVGLNMPSFPEKDWVLHLLMLPIDSKRLLRRLLLDNTSDACCCARSTGGCRGITIFLRGNYLACNWGIRRTYSHYADQTAQIITWLIVTFDRNPKHFNQLAVDILRFLTFNCIGITHTCNHPWRQMAPDDIAEICHEERRMKEYHSCHGTPNEEEMNSLRETGVVLDEPTSTANPNPNLTELFSDGQALVDQLILGDCGVYLKLFYSV